MSKPLLIYALAAVTAVSVSGLRVRAVDSSSSSEPEEIRVENWHPISTVDGFGGQYKQLNYGEWTFDNITVPSGVPYFSVYNYYALNYTGALSGVIEIYVSSFVGRVHLFVGDKYIPQPDYQHFNWSSRTDFDEVVDVQMNNTSCSPGENCVLYIAIMPYVVSYSSYYIRYYNQSGGIVLKDGVPYKGFVPVGYQVNFNITYIPISSFSSYTISLDAVNGDPDAYICLNVSCPHAAAVATAQTILQDTSGVWPSPSHYQYAATSYGGSDTILVSAQDPQFTSSCGVGSPCNFAITIYGFESSSFVLTVSSNSSSVMLLNGIPARGYVGAYLYTYFSYQLSQPINLTIVMTALIGDPDVFVSTVNPTPTIYNNTWMEISTGDSILQITTSDPNYVSPATYYIGVWGYLGNASFSIVATMDSPNFTVVLADGQPQGGQAPAHSFAYYLFTLGNQSLPVDITVAPIAGDVDVYVSNLTYNNSFGQRVFVFPQPYCALPNPAGGCYVYGVLNSTYVWSSTNMFQADVVSIPASQTYPMERLLIAVFATSMDFPGSPAPPSNFTVTATTSIQTLQSGVAVNAQIGPNQFKYYRFGINVFQADVIIVGSPSTGAMNIFVSETVQRPGPGVNNNTWNSSTNGGYVRNQVVYISWDSLSAACQGNISRGVPCPLYISTLGWWNMGQGTCIYSILATISGSVYSATVLDNGKPQFMFVPYLGYQYFIANVNIPSTQAIYVTVTNLVGSTTMYMNVGNAVNKTFPSQSDTTIDFVSRDAGGSEQVTINPGDNSARSVRWGVDLGDPSQAEYVGTVKGHPNKRIFYIKPADGAAIEHTPSRKADVYDGGVLRHTVTDGYPLSKMNVFGEEAKPLGRGRYCNTCPLYISVYGNAASTFSIEYSAGSTFTLLQDDGRVYGVCPPFMAVYYGYTVTDPTVNITININQGGGSVMAYIMVQMPSMPYMMPSPQFKQYSMNVFAGQTSMTFPRTNTSTFCVALDGTYRFPCTYLVAVASRFPNITSSFNIMVSADNNQTITQLQDGNAVIDSIMEGSYNYYYFQASLGPPAPLVTLTSQAFSGRVQLYVTNQYTPGVSSPSYLPRIGSLSCMWVAQNFTNGLTLSPNDACYLPSRTTYTIGVLGSTGNPGVVTEYSLTASLGDSIRLPFGVPITNSFVGQNSGANFTFDMPLAADIIVVVTPNYGQLVLAVKQLHRDGVSPRCVPSATGGPPVCTGYTWLVSQNSGQATAIFINATNPCRANPPVGTLPFTTFNCSADSFTPGRYTVYVYTTSPWASFAVSVQYATQTVRLSDGQPQIGQTARINICPERNITNCLMNSSMLVPTNGAFFQAMVPPETTLVDQFILIERLCYGNQTGVCGSNLIAFVRSCQSSNCQVHDFYPWATTADDFAFVFDATASVKIPWNACAGGLVPTSDCVYNVGVYPVCGDPRRAPPGVNCPSTVLRLTYTGDNSIQRISSDCFSLGNTCTLSAESTPSGIVRRYEAFVNYQPTSTIIRINACQGDFYLFFCSWGTNTTCNPISLPGPTNADARSNTTMDPFNVAFIGGRMSGIFFMGITGMQTYPYDPIFQVVLKSGSGPTLNLWRENWYPAAQRDNNTNAWSWVEWQQPVLSAPGQPSYIPPNLVYYLTAWPLGHPALSAGYKFNQECGIGAALQYYGNTTRGIIRARTMGNYFNLSGLDPATTYVISLTAHCAFNCMPNPGQQEQAATYMNITVPPGKPTPTFGPSASPKPSSPGGSNTGAIVGGVFATLAGAAILGGGFFWYKKKYAAQGYRLPSAAIETSIGSLYSLNQEALLSEPEAGSGQYTAM